MEPWNTSGYRRPRLAPDVEVRTDGALIMLMRDGERRSIRIEAVEDAEAIALDLEALRDPASEPWARHGAGEDDGSWRTLIGHLDAWGFIDDADDDPISILAAHRADADECGAAAVAHVRGLTDEVITRDSVAGVAREWLSLISHDGHQAVEAWHDANFYRAVARLSLARLRTGHPVAFEVALEVLNELAGAPHVAPSRSARAAAGYSLAEMRAHLSAIADLLVRSLGADAKRRCLPAGAHGVLSGTAFARLTERSMRRHAAELGTGAFERAWSGLAAADDPLVIGCHVEEYHVTRRFVEMITPLMAADLDAPLRALIYRYFAEEVGHESFERATCAAFGVEARSLDASCPLPLHLSFVDVFTMLSRRGAVDFLACVSITEGMLGETSPLNERVDALMPDDAEARSIYHRHEELNLGFNHASIPRLALALVPVVDVAEQQRALDSLALVFELNFRAWEALLDFYGGQTKLRLPQAFDPALGRRHCEPIAA